MDLNVTELRARLEAAVAVDAPARPERMTVELLAQMYLAHCRKEFNGQHGRKEAATVRHAFAPLIQLYGDSDPNSLRPIQLRAARHYWIEQGLARTTIQARHQRLRKAFRWARQVGLCDVDLPDIGPLRYGHSVEPDPVKPVDLALVEATLPHVSPRARTLLKLMLYTGMRPGEVCAMRADEIDTSTQPWVYRPKHHKTAWKGCSREIYLGPRAQMLLQSILASAAAARSCNAGVITSCAGSVVGAATTVDAIGRLLFKTARGLPWKPTSLYMAVFNACRKHDIPHWHPNQLRHTFATELRKRFGRDAAQVALGHAKPSMTERYARPHIDAAIAAVQAVG